MVVRDVNRDFVFGTNSSWIYSPTQLLGLTLTDSVSTATTYTISGSLSNYYEYTFGIWKVITFFTNTNGSATNSSGTIRFSKNINVYYFLVGGGGCGSQGTYEFSGTRPNYRAINGGGAGGGAVVYGYTSITGGQDIRIQVGKGATSPVGFEVLDVDFYQCNTYFTDGVKAGGGYSSFKETGTNKYNGAEGGYGRVPNTSIATTIRGSLGASNYNASSQTGDIKQGTPGTTISTLKLPIDIKTDASTTISIVSPGGASGGLILYNTSTNTVPTDYTIASGNGGGGLYPANNASYIGGGGGGAANNDYNLTTYTPSYGPFGVYSTATQASTKTAVTGATDTFGGYGRDGMVVLYFIP